MAVTDYVVIDPSRTCACFDLPLAHVNGPGGMPRDFGSRS